MSTRRHREREREREREGERKCCFCSLLGARKFSNHWTVLQDKNKHFFFCTHTSGSVLKKWLIFNQTPLWAVGWWTRAPGEGWQDKHQSIAKTTAGGGGDIYHTKVATTTCRRIVARRPLRAARLGAVALEQHTKHLIAKLYKTRGNKKGETCENAETQRDIWPSKTFPCRVFPSPSDGMSRACTGEQKQNYIYIIMSACGVYNCFQHT